ncbi:MAG: TRAP transporter small permease, partial [Syntrophomonadaceae bacterium]|nr:TRAP transporter small permease [Syntrophomonadaceae bacterium]
METYTRIISSLSRGLDIIAAASIVAMAVLVTVNILMRGIFKQPLLGTMDIV